MSHEWQGIHSPRTRSRICTYRRIIKSLMSQTIFPLSSISNLVWPRRPTLCYCERQRTPSVLPQKSLGGSTQNNAKDISSTTTVVHPTVATKTLLRRFHEILCDPIAKTELKTRIERRAFLHFNWFFAHHSKSNLSSLQLRRLGKQPTSPWCVSSSILL